MILEGFALLAAFRIKRIEQPVIKPHPGAHSIPSRDPVQGGLDLAAVRGIAAFGGRIVGAAQFHNLAAGRISNHLLAGDEIGVAQAHLAARRQAEEFLGRVLQKIILLDVDLPGKGHGTGAHIRIFGIVHRLKDFRFAPGIIFDHHLQGPQHPHDPRCPAVEVFADAVLQQGDVHRGIGLGHTDALAKIADRLRGVAPAPQPGDSGHARIVPALYVAFVDQLDQLALAQHHKGQIQAGEFVLVWTAVRFDLVQYPIIQHAIVFKLQGTNGMGDALQGIRKAMGEIIHGIDAPLVPGAVVVGLADAIEGGIAHDHIRMGHVDFGPQHMGAVFEFPAAHALEQVQVLLDAPVAIGALLPRLGQRAPHGANFLGAGTVHIGLALADQLHGEFI